ncbi:MAG TPA: hypothetical protein ENJ95_17630 [Bacteroidetes bacterium]|nr:hypothetical protein [Bacteroidota bacterium]
MDEIYCATLGFVHRGQVLPFWGWGLAGANAQNLKWCSIIMAAILWIGVLALNYETLFGNKEAGQ